MMFAAGVAHRPPPWRRTGMTTIIPLRRLATVGAVAAVCAVAVAAAATLSPALGSGPAAAADRPAQSDGEPIRISFAPGTDHATVQGTFREGRADTYVLRARGGQEMMVQVRPVEAAASVGIYAPDGAQLPSQPGVDFRGRLPATGDYRIVIGGGRGDASPTYTLTVRIPAAPRRVTFAAGTDNATLRGSIADTRTDRYVLRARAGQQMTLSPVAPLRVTVTAPDGSLLPGGPAETITFALPRNGDYVIEVLPGMGEADTYAITVTIPSASPPAPQRVRFAPGTNSASLLDTVGAGAVDRFVLTAAAGQTMAVHVNADADNAVASIAAPDGTVLSQDQLQASVVLPSNGDYVVSVRSTDGAATYRISFWIV